MTTSKPEQPPALLPDQPLTGDLPSPSSSDDTQAPIGRDPEQVGSDAENDFALRKYAALLGYLQYENTVYWTRSQFFLVANAALLGLLASGLPTSSDIAWARIYTLAIATAGGVLLSQLWKWTLEASEQWIDRWHRRIVELEPAAFGTMTLFRDVNHHEGKYPIKALARKTNLLFRVLWALAMLYLIGVTVTKALGWDLL